MKRLDLWKLSLLNVFAAPLRSVLTILGMAIGIGAILAVLTLGQAGRTQVRSEMARLGIDRVWLSAEGEAALRLGDGQLIAGALAVEAAEAAYLPAEASCGQYTAALTVVGCTQAYLDMNGVQLAQGRMLYPLEWRAGSACALLGVQAAEKLDVTAGGVVFVMGKPLRVAGLVESGDSVASADPAQCLFLPAEALCCIIGKEIQEIVLDVPPHAQPQEVAHAAQGVLRRQRGVSARAATLQVQLEAADSVITIFVEVLKWVAFVCILVGGIGVMNILLVSVRERRREIGVMKSLGADCAQISTLFLMEALLYALIGGVLGVLIGLGLIAAAGNAIGLNARAAGGDCAAVLGASLLVGLFFGVAPAVRAAGLSCVDALRDEK